MIALLWLASVVLFILKLVGVGALATVSWWLIATPAIVGLGLSVVALLGVLATARKVSKDF